VKVIAKASDSKYICEVSHDELEKFMNQYYGNMKRLEVGDDVNLGQGYDFSSRIEQVCKNMAESMRSFDSARKTMTDFAVAIAQSAHHEQKAGE
jgi:predicted component of type VI protein secretion system